MEKQNSITLKVDNACKKQLIDFYKSTTIKTPPPYSVFRAMEEKVNVTLYNSGKCLFQGENARSEADLWLRDSRIIELEKKDPLKDRETLIQYDKYNVIGSDEVGTGDYFGPIVVVAAYVRQSDVYKIKSLGVKDSKGLTDKKILEIAPELIKEVDYEILLLSNEEYNANNQYNMNHMKAILHNKVLSKLSLRNNQENHLLLMDQFTTEKSFYKYLSNVEKPTRKFYFETKAESISTAVATASVIARYTFLKQIDKMSEELNMKIPLGASSKVEEFGKILYEKYGNDILKKNAKYNFKTTMKIIS